MGPTPNIKTGPPRVGSNAQALAEKRLGLRLEDETGGARHAIIVATVTAALTIAVTVAVSCMYACKHEES